MYDICLHVGPNGYKQNSLSLRTPNKCFRVVHSDTHFILAAPAAFPYQHSYDTSYTANPHGHAPPHPHQYRTFSSTPYTQPCTAASHPVTPSADSAPYPIPMRITLVDKKLKEIEMLTCGTPETQW